MLQCAFKTDHYILKYKNLCCIIFLFCLSPFVKLSNPHFYNECMTLSPWPHQYPLYFLHTMCHLRFCVFEVFHLDGKSLSVFLSGLFFHLSFCKHITFQCLFVLSAVSDMTFSFTFHTTITERQARAKETQTSVKAAALFHKFLPITVRT